MRKGRPLTNLLLDYTLRKCSVGGQNTEECSVRGQNTEEVGGQNTEGGKRLRTQPPSSTPHSNSLIRKPSLLIKFIISEEDTPTLSMRSTFSQSSRSTFQSVIPETSSRIAFTCFISRRV